ncbi:MAG: filamentous hemagglutinin N-terminal domain-containing protein, partial [Chloroflexota bacterium]
MPVLAQVAADNTVGTTVIGNSPFTVTGGTQQLTTLFHSFTEFSPGTANVLFQLNGSQSTVETVIGRITGTNASLIDGQLRLTGGNNPDLFLINPNGITFEANATLDLPGSFTASTAESVLLADDQPFSATNPAAAPLLTVSTPVGFQMGRASGDIHIEDTGYGLADISNLSSPGVSGLEVQP